MAEENAAPLLPPRSACLYTACYCEENVWQLAARVRDAGCGLEDCYAVFVSNPREAVPLWAQRAGRDGDGDGDGDGVVVWDYHVIFVHAPEGGAAMVYDLDTRLAFPEGFARYAGATFRSDAGVKPEFHRWFRVVPAAVYLKTFASDRRHMRAPDGGWLQPPPAYPCIRTAGDVHNLPAFIAMAWGEGVGDVLSLADFVARFDVGSA